MHVRKTLGIAALGLGLGGLATWQTALVQEPASRPQHRVPPSSDGDVVVAMCDGETTLEVEGVKDPSTITREKAQAISDELMLAWRKKNPDARWDPPPPRLVAQANPPRPPAPAPASLQASVRRAAWRRSFSQRAAPLLAVGAAAAAIALVKS